MSQASEGIDYSFAQVFHFPVKVKSLSICL